MHVMSLGSCLALQRHEGAGLPCVLLHPPTELGQRSRDPSLPGPQGLTASPAHPCGHAAVAAWQSLPGKSHPSPWHGQFQNLSLESFSDPFITPATNISG